MLRYPWGFRLIMGVIMLLLESIIVMWFIDCTPKTCLSSGWTIIGEIMAVLYSPLPLYMLIVALNSEIELNSDTIKFSCLGGRWPRIYFIKDIIVDYAPPHTNVFDTPEATTVDIGKSIVTIHSLMINYGEFCRFLRPII